MKRKLLSTVLIFVTLFSICDLFKYNVNAMSAPFLYFDEEKDDAVTNDNAILNVKMVGTGKNVFNAFDIEITCENEEVVKYQKKVTDDNYINNTVYATFDIKKDSGKALEPGREYFFTIKALDSENFSGSMYTLKHHFVTNNVKVTSAIENVKKNTASIKVAAENPESEKISKIGFRLYSNGRLLKDHYKTVEETAEKAEYTFDIKADAGIALAQNKKYDCVAYAELDVSDKYYYKSFSFSEGSFKTPGQPTITTKIQKSKKYIKFKNTIENPFGEKISDIRIVAVAGKKKCEIYSSKISKKNSKKLNQTITVKVKKSKIKQLLKKRKFNYTSCITIGKKVIKSKGKVKI